MEEFNEKKPLKRVQELQFLSHDHHHGLLLGWKIRTGFKKGVAIERIKAYCDWFYESYLKEHFAIEEQFVYPVLEAEHQYIQQALKEHADLRALFESRVVSEENLHQIEKLIVDHIRFEERTLFQVVQQIATDEQLKMIKESDSLQQFVENEENSFWL